MERAEQESLSIGYLATVLGLMGVLPIGSFVVERLVWSAGEGAWESAFRWFLFWGVGLRLFTAGLRQIVQPAFTAREIFRLSNPDAEIVVRELGFANVCMGLGAVVANFVSSFRPCAAFIGGLYLALLA